MVKFIIYIMLFLGAVIRPTFASEPDTSHTSDSSQDRPVDPSRLIYIAQDKSQSIEHRSEALRQLATYPSENALVAIARNLKDSHPELRIAAIEGASAYQIDYRWGILKPLLNDKQLDVRMASTSNLLRDYAKLTDKQQQTLTAPSKELIEHLSKQNDLASKAQLADVYRWQGELELSTQLYKQVVSADPHAVSAWVSLADNERAMMKGQLALKTINKALEFNPKDASLHYSKSLALVRMKDKQQAANEIELATQLDENNSYYWYLNGVLQEEFNLQASIHSFEQAYLISGAPAQLYAVCDVYLRHQNPKTQACLDELSKVAPPNVVQPLTEKYQH